MDPQNATSIDLKAAILADSQLFLSSLSCGASDDQLNEILDRIKARELQLTTEHGLKLSPELWNILLSRLANRKPKDIIDTVPNWSLAQEPS